MKNLPTAKTYATSALSFFKQFNVTSPSLMVLRELGLCDEGLGNLQRQIALSHSISPSERQAGQEEERKWYLKSDAVWIEWKRRGAATPGSERERRKVEHLLATIKENDQTPRPSAQ
jgi:hypothetical protein